MNHTAANHIAIDYTATVDFVVAVTIVGDGVGVCATGVTGPAGGGGGVGSGSGERANLSECAAHMEEANTVRAPAW